MTFGIVELGGRCTGEDGGPNTLNEKAGTNNEGQLLRKEACLLFRWVVKPGKAEKTWADQSEAEMEHKGGSELGRNLKFTRYTEKRRNGKKRVAHIHSP